MRVIYTPRKAIVLATAVTGMMLQVTTAQAEESSEESRPFYIGIGSGVVFRGHAKDFAGNTTFDPGFAINFAAGGRIPVEFLPYGFRLEAEASLQDNETDELNAFALGRGREHAYGDVEFTSYMANLYYDLKTPYSWLGTPYVGIGIGTYKGEINNFSNKSLRSLGIKVDGSTGYQFAMQFRVGTTYALTSRLDLSAGYRLFRAQNFEFQVPAAIGAPNNTLHPHPSPIDLHGIELGLKLNF